MTTERCGVLSCLFPLNRFFGSQLPLERGQPMPELLRSVVSRMRIYVKDRRQSPRLRVRLLFTVSMKRQANGNGSRRRERLMQGHTRDITMKGLALNLPQDQPECHHP